MCLRAKFEVSSIIRTSFRQWGNFNTPPPPPTCQNKPLKIPPRLGLKGHLLGPYVPLCPIAGEHEFFLKLFFDTLLHFLNCAKFQKKN